MEEITLTGGTMSKPSKKCKSHCDSHGCHQHGGDVQMTEQPAPERIEDLLSSPPEDISQALFTLLRFGRYEAMEPVLLKLREQQGIGGLAQILLMEDDGGHSVVHWAAKRVDDLRFLQNLIVAIQELQLAADQNLTNQPSKDNVGMYPLHWACTEDGSIPHIALLLKSGADIEARDNSGCTPLLIAAQYGQVEVVAYLLKHGANLHALDGSNDGAVAWAAYKGSTTVLGLLTYFPNVQLNTQDTYGQTPLHLAALRGHTSTVRYILQNLPKQDILFLKDKNERTPLDLAIHKNRPNVEVVLREAMAKVEDPQGHFFKKTLWKTMKNCCSLKTWQIWMGLTGGMDDMDGSVKFPFFFVLFNFILHFGFFITVFAPIRNMGNGLMWDKSGWLLFNFANMLFLWYFYYKTVTTKPGFLDNSCPGIEKWRQRYEETLDAYADDNLYTKMSDLPSLCHTCHIARPFRSKHCRFQRKCVLVFDHYCPFVDNTIGLYNYKYFFWFLFFTTIGLLCFMITLFQYIGRYRVEHSMPWTTLLLGIELSILLFPVGMLFVYHTQLAMVNLTTNEHINVRKYKYLHPMVNGKKQYKNPWFKGYFGNFMDRMQPSETCYLVPSDRQGLVATASGENIV